MTAAHLRSGALEYNRNCNTGRGCYIDLPTAEHENTRPVLARGVISFVTNVTGSSDCSASSYLYVLDVLTGQKSDDSDITSSLISPTANSSGVIFSTTSSV